MGQTNVEAQPGLRSLAHNYLRGKCTMQANNGRNLSQKMPEEDNEAGELDKATKLWAWVIQRIAVVSMIPDQVLRLGFDHIKVEA